MQDGRYQPVAAEPPPPWNPSGELNAAPTVAARALDAPAEQLRGFDLIHWKHAPDMWAIAIGPTGETIALPMVACSGGKPRVIATVALGVFERLQAVIPLDLDNDAGRPCTPHGPTTPGISPIRTTRPTARSPATRPRS
jgi:hypothetical protein